MKKIIIIGILLVALLISGVSATVEIIPNQFIVHDFGNGIYEFRNDAGNSFMENFAAWRATYPTIPVKQIVELNQGYGSTYALLVYTGV